MKIGFIFPSFYPVNDLLPKFYNGLETRDYWLAKYLDKETDWDIVIVGPQDSKLDNFKGEVYGKTPCVGTNPLSPIQLEYLTIEKNKKELKDCDIIHDDTHFKQSYHFKKYFYKNILCFTWDHHPDNLRSFPKFDPNIICISKWQENEIKKKYNWANTQVIYPGLNIDFYSQYLEDNLEKKYHVFLSRLSSIKGPHFVLELAKSYSNEEFIILGDVLFTQEPYYAWALKVESEKLDNIKIIFNASFKEKIYYLNRAKSYLHLALWEEPFGLTTIEGLYFNTPVFTIVPDLKRSGINEILKEDLLEAQLNNICYNYNIGMKVKINRNNLEETTKNIINNFKLFLDNIDNYKGVQMRKYIETEWNIEKTYEGYIQYFKDLIL